MSIRSDNQKRTPADSGGEGVGMPAARSHNSAASPVWTWGVVLVSTLLFGAPILSASALPAALLAAASSAPASSPVAAMPPTAEGQAPNRVAAVIATPRRLQEEEQEALRAAVRSGKAVLVRLDDDQADQRQLRAPATLYALFVLHDDDGALTALKTSFVLPPSLLTELSRPDVPASASRFHAYLARALSPRAPPLSLVFFLIA